MKKEITLAEFENFWGKSDCENGLSFFQQSHPSVADIVKADSNDLTITALNEILEICE